LSIRRLCYLLATCVYVPGMRKNLDTVKDQRPKIKHQTSKTPPPELSSCSVASQKL
jgi:hypothetical protein